MHSSKDKNHEYCIQPNPNEGSDYGVYVIGNIGHLLRVINFIRNQ